jgi:hypothetical protein
MKPLVPTRIECVQNLGHWPLYCLAVWEPHLLHSPCHAVGSATKNPETQTLSLNDDQPLRAADVWHNRQVVGLPTVQHKESRHKEQVMEQHTLPHPPHQQGLFRHKNLDHAMHNLGHKGLAWQQLTSKDQAATCVSF